MDVNDAGEPSSERESEIARKDAEWAAKADAPPRTAIHTPGPGAGPALGGPTAGTGQAPGSATYRTPKHLRSGSGPRFSGRGVFAVFGLLGVLLTVGVMVFLFVRVVDGVTGGTGPTGEPDVGADPSGLVPGLPGTPEPGASGEGTEINPDRPRDAARTASCDAERDTIELASQTYELLHGRTPTIDELVDEGLLQPAEGGFSHEMAPDGSIVGTGPCAP